MRRAVIVMIIMAVVVSLPLSGCAAQKSRAGQSLDRLDKFTAVYNPFSCQEITYLHDQLAVYLKKTIGAGTFSGQAGLKESQNNKAAEDMDSFSLPALMDRSLAAEIAFFFLADDDIHMVLRFFRPGE